MVYIDNFFGSICFSETLADDERGVRYLLIIHPYGDIDRKPLRKG